MGERSTLRRHRLTRHLMGLGPGGQMAESESSSPRVDVTLMDLCPRRRRKGSGEEPQVSCRRASADGWATVTRQIDNSAAAGLAKRGERLKLCSVLPCHLPFGQGA